MYYFNRDCWGKIISEPPATDFVSIVMMSLSLRAADARRLMVRPGVR